MKMFSYNGCVCINHESLETSNCILNTKSHYFWQDNIEGIPQKQ